MNRVYIIEQGSYLRKDGESLRLVRPGGDDVLIPCTGLEQLTLIGRTTLSGAVLDFLIRKRVETVFMAPSGRFRARLLLDEPGHVVRRRTQYGRLSDDVFRLQAARVFVCGKLDNQVCFLLGRVRRGGPGEVRALALQIRALSRQAAGCGDFDSLRGMEGMGARLFFQGFGMLVNHPELRFTGRNRRPPRDPVNAMLSFVYTLFTNEVLSAVKAAGLDPYLGALHEPEHGRPSLACDLVEEWRVFADRIVLSLINRKMVGRDDFVIGESLGSGESVSKAVEMKPAIYRALVNGFERFMQSSLPGPAGGTQVRWLIHGQVRAFAVWLENASAVYHPYRLTG